MKSGVGILLCALLLAVPVGVSAQGRPSNEIEMVKRIEAIRVAALVSADSTILSGLFAPDATYVHSNGLVQSRDELIRVLTRGEIRYVSVNVEKVNYRAYDGVIVGVGVQRMEVEASGQSKSLRSRFTVVYAGSGMNLKLVAYQSTPAPDLAPLK